MSNPPRVVSLCELCGNKCLMAPDFQRPYAWEERHVEELWNLLYESFNKRKSEKIMLYTVHLWGRTDEKIVYVIDGQQRIVTLLLTLAVLRDFSDDDNFKMDIQQECFTRRTFIDDNDTLRFVPASGESSLCVQVIQEIGKTNEVSKKQMDAIECSIEDERVAAAVRTIKGKVAECFNGAKKGGQVHSENIGTNLKEFAKFIWDNCTFVEYFSVSEDTAVDSFVELNSRGLPLSAYDKLKAMVYASYRTDETHWREVRETLDKFGGDEESLWQAFCISLPTLLCEFSSNHFSSLDISDLLNDSGFFDEESVFTEWEKLIRSDTVSHNALRDALNIAGEVMKLLQGESKEAQKRRVLFTLLELLKMEEWKLVAVAVLFYCEKNGDDEGPDPLSLLLKMERVAVRWLLLQGKANPAQNVHHMIQSFHDKHWDDAFVFNRTDLPLERVSKRGRVSEQMDTIAADVIYGKLHRKEHISRYLLLRLEYNLPNAEIHNDPDMIQKATLEHVCPISVSDVITVRRKPAELENWRENGWKDTGLVELHRIGNFALLVHEENIRSSNLSFEGKKKLWTREKATKYSCTRELVHHYGAFTPYSAERRRLELCKQLCELYNLPARDLESNPENFQYRKLVSCEQIRDMLNRERGNISLRSFWLRHFRHRELKEATLGGFLQGRVAKPRNVEPYLAFLNEVHNDGREGYVLED